MSSTDSKTAKIQAHFKNLASIAPVLNTASDELTKAIRGLDQALKKLNIGLSVWVTFAERTEDPGDGQYNLEQIGYTKLNGEWGLALRHIWGHERYDAHNEDGPWLFSDAPRDMRLRSTDKIPEVIESLGNEAVKTTKAMQRKSLEVRELAGAIEQISTSAQPTIPKALSEAALKTLRAGGLANTLTPFKEGSK